VCDVPDTYVGVVTERLGERRGRMVKMSNPGHGRARLEFEVPSRGLIGFRGEFLTATRGTGLLNTHVHGWQPWGGPMMKRANGRHRRRPRARRPRTRCFTCSRAARSSSRPGVDVYEGMIVGEHNRPNDTDVNVIREKKLTNVRNHGKDENVHARPPRRCSPSRRPWSGSTATSSSR
jgi:GTP-binding protein